MSRGGLRAATWAALGLAGALVFFQGRPAGASVARRTPVVEAVEKTLPSVVNIGTERLVKVYYSDPQQRFRGDLIDRLFSDFFRVPPPPGLRMSHSLGSGVIVDPLGYIVTNYHVIERASRIRVVMADESVYDAVVLAGDTISDLALLKIEPAQPLRAVEFAEDDDLLLGETVVVMGNPFGLTHSVSVGVLSAKDREATYQGEVLFRDILQTDAAVNLGNSGGPLVNLDGQLMGINVSIFQEAQNIGFAIPVRRVRALLAEWFSPGLLKRLWLGFDAVETEACVRVAEVEEGSPAAKARVLPGDGVTAVDGQPVRRLYELNKALLSKNAGDTVKFGLERAGERHEADVTIAALPKPSGSDLARKRLGLVFGDPQAAGRAAFRKGLPVEEVLEGSAAARLGLQPGFWVTRINRSELRSLDDVGIALESVRAGEPVSLVVVKVEERESVIVAQSTTVQVMAE